MVADPALTPVIIPVVLPTVATEVLLLVHVPPDIAFKFDEQVGVTVELTHTPKVCPMVLELTEIIAISNNEEILFVFINIFLVFKN